MQKHKDQMVSQLSFSLFKKNRKTITILSKLSKAVDESCRISKHENDSAKKKKKKKRRGSVSLMKIKANSK